MKSGVDLETIGGRYASVRFGAALSKKAFAESLGIHPVVSGDIELGKRDPSRDVLVRLARVWNVDINWLLTGHRSSHPEAEQDAFSVLIPLVGQEAAAGRGVEIDESAEIHTFPVPRTLLGRKHPERIRAVSVRGDSMHGVGLDDGDIVLFAIDDREGDGIHVVSAGSQLLVKRVHFDPLAGCVHLISENPRYPPRLIEGTDLETFRVEGRVIAWMHRAV